MYRNSIQPRYNLSGFKNRYIIPQLSACPNFVHVIVPDRRLFNAPTTGDIIFINPRKKTASQISQNILRFHLHAYSHVAFNLTGDLLLHSMPSSGTSTVSPQDLIIAKEHEISVYRLASFQNSPDEFIDIQRKIINDSSVYYQKHYNYGFFIPRKIRSLFNPKLSDSSFCSELVCEIYEKIGVSVSSKPKHKSLPIDLHRYISSSPEWIDVSHLYENYFDVLHQPDQLEAVVRIQTAQKKAYDWNAKVVVAKQKSEIDKKITEINKCLHQIAVRLFLKKFCILTQDWFELLRKISQLRLMIRKAISDEHRLHAIKHYSKFILFARMIRFCPKASAIKSNVYPNPYYMRSFKTAFLRINLPVQKAASHKVSHSFSLKVPRSGKH